MGVICHGQVIPSAGCVVVSLCGYGPVALGTSFDATESSSSLGFFEVNVEDLRHIRGRLRYKRVGTGTLNIQLWDETTASSLFLLTDSSTTTPQDVSSSIAFSQGSGIHLLRVRIRSSVETDVPIFYGASFILSA